MLYLTNNYLYKLDISFRCIHFIHLKSLIILTIYTGKSPVECALYLTPLTDNDRTYIINKANYNVKEVSETPLYISSVLKQRDNNIIIILTINYVLHLNTGIYTHIFILARNL